MNRQAPLPIGPNGEIPLRRGDDGDVVYASREELWGRAAGNTPDEKAAAIGALQEAIERLRLTEQTPRPAAPAPVPQPTPETDDDGPRLLTAREVGAALGIPYKSVYELGGLERVQLGKRRVRWRAEDVEAFIERRRQSF